MNPGHCVTGRERLLLQLCCPWAIGSGLWMSRMRKYGHQPCFCPTQWRYNWLWRLAPGACTSENSADVVLFHWIRSNLSKWVVCVCVYVCVSLYVMCMCISGCFVFLHLCVLCVVWAFRVWFERGEMGAPTHCCHQMPPSRHHSHTSDHSHHPQTPRSLCLALPPPSPRILTLGYPSIYCPLCPLQNEQQCQAAGMTQHERPRSRTCVSGCGLQPSPTNRSTASNPCLTGWALLWSMQTLSPEHCDFSIWGKKRFPSCWLTCMLLTNCLVCVTIQYVNIWTLWLVVQIVPPAKFELFVFHHKMCRRLVCIASLSRIFSCLFSLT